MIPRTLVEGGSLVVLSFKDLSTRGVAQSHQNISKHQANLGKYSER